MSLLSTIKSLVFPDAGMVCPRCEKPLEGHDEAACERRMSRRYFFGVAVGAVAGAMALPKLLVGLDAADGKSYTVLSVVESDLLTTDVLLDAAMKRYRLTMKSMLGSETGWSKTYVNMRIGDSINIVRPKNFHL